MVQKMGKIRLQCQNSRHQKNGGSTSGLTSGKIKPKNHQRIRNWKSRELIDVFGNWKTSFITSKIRQSKNE